MISKIYNTDRTAFYRKFFELYNVIQTSFKTKLRDREIDILAELIYLKPTLNFKLFKNEGKQAVIDRIQKRTGIELTMSNINTHLSELKKKGLILEQSDRMKYINPQILKYLETDDKQFEFLFKFNINE